MSSDLPMASKALSDGTFVPESDPLLWERQAHEPVFWFNIFTQCYLVLGLGRSLQKAYKAYMVSKGADPALLGPVPTVWRNVYKAWEWEARAYAWDEQNSYELSLQWVDRLREHREQEWEMRTQLVTLAQTALQTLLDKTAGDGTLTVSIKDLNVLISLASKLGREATGGEGINPNEKARGEMDIVKIREQRWAQVKDLVADVVLHDDTATVVDHSDADSYQSVMDVLDDEEE